MPFISTAIAIGTAIGVGGGGFWAGAAGYAVISAAGYGATKAVGAIAGGGQKQLTGPSGGNAENQLAAAQEAASVKAQSAQREKQRAISRSRTIYSSPLGVQEQADTAAKTLLGE